MIWTPHRNRNQPLIPLRSAGKAYRRSFPQPVEIRESGSPQTLGSRNKIPGSLFATCNKTSFFGLEIPGGWV
jgi:hypothetical protein